MSVSFTPDMILTMSKEAFLHVPSNKQKLISMIGEELKKHGCHIHHDRADADLQIVQRTIQLASMTDTVLVGDDTDLLVLLLYHASHTKHEIYFAPDPKKNS